MKRTLLGLAPLTLALATVSLAACGDDGQPGTEAGETAGDGDGDQTGDGDGDQTGDGDGDQTGDGDGEPEPDADMDGVPDSSDNCPDLANPNQLDFDGNGAGNVCDVQVFTGVTGTLNTTATASITMPLPGECNIPVPLDVTGGEIRIQLDDDAAVAAFEIVQLDVADILDQQCDLGLATATVSLTNFVVTNSGDPFPVSVPHSLAAHDAGSIAGDSDMPHPVLSTATLEAAVLNNPPMASDLMLDGSLPVFTANISGAGAMGTLAWADGQHVVATDVFMIPNPLGGADINIDFELKGLVGSLVLAP